MNESTNDPMSTDASSDASTDKNAVIIEAKKVVAFSFRYRELLADNEYSEWMEQSKEGEPRYYLHGYQNVISGVERALAGKAVGDKVDITLAPEEAYGLRNPDAVQRVPLKHLQLPNGISKARAGGLARIRSEQGWHNVIILKPGKFNADVDFNHPLAGRTLNYEIEIIAIRDASEEEIAHGHVHGEGGHQH